ncbi:MAG: hypothetical protein CME32_12605 [Gimesia sp.]|nr:hypothetical protein [Gimesia sp.]
MSPLARSATRIIKSPLFILGSIRDRVSCDSETWIAQSVESNCSTKQAFDQCFVAELSKQFCVNVECHVRLTSEDVINVLAELFKTHGVPEHIRSDNGSEFVAQAIREWLKQIGVETLYIEPASPWENGYAESFHSRVRDEFMNCEIFENLRSARKQTDSWKEFYNEVRPHSSLGYLTPRQFSQQCISSSRTTSAFQRNTADTQLLS